MTPLKIADLLLYSVDDRLKTVHWILESKNVKSRSKISIRVTSYSQSGENLVNPWVKFYREKPNDQVS